MPVFVDTNIFLYAAGADHPLKGPCAELLRRAATGALDATTSAEVIQEIHHVFRRRGQLRDGIALGRQVAKLFPEMLPVTRADVLRSGEILFAHPQLSPRDALHAATALNSQITTILTVNTDFDQIRGLVRLDPASA